jgi:hypothetical protein
MQTTGLGYAVSRQCPLAAARSSAALGALVDELVVWLGLWCGHGRGEQARGGVWRWRAVGGWTEENSKTTQTPAPTTTSATRTATGSTSGRRRDWGRVNRLSAYASIPCYLCVAVALAVSKALT